MLRVSPLIECWESKNKKDFCCQVTLSIIDTIFIVYLFRANKGKRNRPVSISPTRPTNMINGELSFIVCRRLYMSWPEKGYGEFLCEWTSHGCAGLLCRYSGLILLITVQLRRDVSGKRIIPRVAMLCRSFPQNGKSSPYHETPTVNDYFCPAEKQTMVGHKNQQNKTSAPCLSPDPAKKCPHEWWRKTVIRVKKLY